MAIVKSSFSRRRIIVPVALIAAWAGGCVSRVPHVHLFEWQRGIGVESLEQPGMAMYLWFYEWHMFDAVKPGQHTAGGFSRFTRYVCPDGKEAELRSDNMVLKAVAVRDGAELQLAVTNRSAHDWPEEAGIIPCFNPGPAEKRNPHFANTNTYFVGTDGLVRQEKREIHFNADLRDRIDARADQGAFVFSHKWPTSPVSAVSGLLVRESNDGDWVAGIAWERFLSAQGHNPWECMHLCVRCGPLQRGQSRTIRGRIYLFKGDRYACLRRYRGDFEPQSGRGETFLSSAATPLFDSTQE